MTSTALKFALDNSAIAECGANIDIGTTTPATLLDVNGFATLRGIVSLLASAATIGAGTNALALQLGARTYSSDSDALGPQNSVWQAVSAGNRRARPTANLTLLFGTGTTLPVSTSLSISSNGGISFAPEQTFSGSNTDSGTGRGSGTINGAEPGPGLTGGGSSGMETISLASPLSPSNGGAGAARSAGALASLGAIPISGGTTTGPINNTSANFSGKVAAGTVTSPNAAPAGTLSGNSVYIPGLIVPITAFGAKCDWNGTTGTDDTAAWKAAWAAIHTYPTGGEITMPACSSYVPNGLNFSTNAANYQASYTIRGQGKTASAIVTKNAAVGLDLGGVNNVHLDDFELTDVGTGAKVGIARYRVAMNGNYGGGGHTYRNLEVFGSYSLAALYSVGSENNDHYNVDLMETGSGAGFSISSQNCLNLTGQGQPIPASSSDTVNHFYGGILQTAGKSTGGNVMFCNGSADNLSFDGTYFASYSTYNIRFGQSAHDIVQGTKSFHSVRFEGSADAISFNAYGVDSLVIDSGSTFGEVSPGIDLNWLNPNPAYGLNMADIHGNSHLGRGLILPLISNSRIQVSTLYSYPSYPLTTITVSEGISESQVEANAFSLGTQAYVSGSMLIQNDDNLSGSKKILFGPNSPTSKYNSAGSVIVMQPFGTAPVNPIIGELAIADGVNWRPDGVTSQTLMQWTGTAWVPACH